MGKCGRRAWKTQKNPTGDLSYPPEVRLAKRCKAVIGEKEKLVFGEDAYNRETDDFGGLRTSPAVQLNAKKDNACHQW